MKKIVIMQPYYFAWYGFFEQIKLADIYVFYDDVQFRKRSLMNRVTIRTSNGDNWLTVPLRDVHLGDVINEIKCNDDLKWRLKHLKSLKNSYNKAPYVDEMLDLAKKVFDDPSVSLVDISIKAIEEVVRYFEIGTNTMFYRSSELNIDGQGSQRLLDITKALGGDVYVTGMGALNYMDFTIFDQANVAVEFMDYAKTPYPQLHNNFNPFVSILDLIANAGKGGVEYMNSKTMNYHDFLETEEARQYLKK